LGFIVVAFLALGGKAVVLATILGEVPDLLKEKLQRLPLNGRQLAESVGLRS
jgi:hypothetical protein